MTERLVFNTQDGSFDALIFRPSTSPASGILVVPEVFGRSTQLQDMAMKFVRAGFLVGVLDIHWRVAKELALEPHETERARSLHQELDYDLAISDIATAVDVFRSDPGCTGKVAVMGFCLGGTLAWLAAAHTSADVCVSYYGTRIPKYIGAASEFVHPLVMHMGEADRFTPPDVIAAITLATENQPGVVRFVYPGARHAFCNPAQSGYDAEAAELAYHRSLEFLHIHLDETG